MKQTITVPACEERLDDVISFVVKAMKETGIESKTQSSVKVAVGEIFVNIMSYAYPSGEFGEVTVSATAEADRLVIEFADSGTPYDPLAKADPDTTLPAAERDIGGLGVYMVKKMMDNVSYRYEGNQNILTIEKNYEPKNYAS